MTDEFLLQKLEALTGAVQQQMQVSTLMMNRLKELEAKINENAGLVDKLAALQGLEWIEELKQWVSQAKWQALRNHPRDEPASEKPAK